MSVRSFVRSFPCPFVRSFVPRPPSVRSIVRSFVCLSSCSFVRSFLSRCLVIVRSFVGLFVPFVFVRSLILLVSIPSIVFVRLFGCFFPFNRVRLPGEEFRWILLPEEEFRGILLPRDSRVVEYATKGCRICN